jgi:hypothetical protein
VARVRYRKKRVTYISPKILSDEKRAEPRPIRHSRQRRFEASDEEIKRFWKSCFYFAYRKHPRVTVCEDFAQEAYLYKYRHGRIGTIYNYWQSFTRDSTYNTSNQSAAAMHALWHAYDVQVRLSDDSKYSSVSKIETGIADQPEDERIWVPKNLTERQQMICVLVQCGFKMEDIATAFSLDPYLIHREVAKIRKKLSGESLEADELFESIERDPIDPGVAKKIEIQKEMARRQKQINRKPKHVDINFQSMEIEL